MNSCVMKFAITLSYFHYLASAVIAIFYLVDSFEIHTKMQNGIVGVSFQSKGTKTSALFTSFHPTLSSSITKKGFNPEQQQESQSQRHHHQCDLCNATFESRNAMFRHIRKVHASNIVGGGHRTQKYSISIHFGYLKDCIGAGEVVCKAFQKIYPKVSTNDNDNDDDYDGTSKMEVISTSQTSIAKSRPRCLGQESDCPAAEDILFINFRCQDEMNWNASIASLLVQEIAKRASTIRNDITVHGIREMKISAGNVIHAEHSCTQEVFHFLLPIRWLPNVDEILEWYLDQKRNNGRRHAGSSHAPTSLRQFKELLRRIESPRSNRVTADRRFGSLKHKMKRPWHCYADPELKGEASPNTESVWRIVDRARWIRLVEDPDDEKNIFLVTEFCGDAFLKQQIRRIMGTLIAMAHGWLPDTFLEQTINADVLVETPIAPANHLYRATSRFHAFEIYHRGRRFFELDDMHRVDPERDPTGWIQRKLIGQIRFDQDSSSSSFLASLQYEVCPQICKQLNELAAVTQGITMIGDGSQYVRQRIEPPDVYNPVLNLLRDLVATKRWPSTSTARAAVIHNLSNQTSNDDGGNSWGSFTVVSEKEFETDHLQLPMGNSLFPDLASAVFDLERHLCALVGSKDDNDDDNYNPNIDLFRQRLPSSHCAINCNAQFTPHVDSGRGSGQSLSMIVGLGNYNGGELMLEGVPHNIRYDPLEFDGWKRRHWTRPFDGERFSLVWFTPEGMIRKNEPK